MVRLLNTSYLIAVPIMAPSYTYCLERIDISLVGLAKMSSFEACHL